ncbi:TadG family pilus assembly protein [uncultured Celeribacter sp.]|uniref:TadG family pilus assembly protein n=1 Tax=uncultured Celeribacter sp. TaxID=1303376 RepID=UPI002AA7175F|nr:TadG family pilus assembly protein [uncultured Celeribacter sp.]
MQKPFSMKLSRPARHQTEPHSFLRRDEGAVTAFSLFLAAIIAVILGVGVDSFNLWRARQEIQVAADAAALAAAANVNDLTKAGQLAHDLTVINLSGDDTALADPDIIFGSWDAETESFTALSDMQPEEGQSEPVANAVQVTVRRLKERSNPVDTYLMRLAGVNSFDIGATSVARLSEGGGTVTITSGNSCAAATFLSSYDVTSGGGNEFHEGVCIYGQNGVSFGGDDYYSSKTRVIADDIDTITLNTPRQDSAPVEEVKAEGHMDPVLVPQVNNMFAEHWNAFYGHNGETYSGDLVPDFIKNPNTGTAKIVQKDWYWSIQPGEIEPYTIYVVKGGAQFSGDLDAHNVMFIVDGYFGTGGGWNLHFYDMVIFGTQIGLAGNVQWGDPTITCGENRYSVYMFAKDSINMGGWSAPTPIDGLVVAAPKIEPGGAMTGSHLYMESTQNFNIGGAWNISGCSDTPMESYWTLSTYGEEVTVVSSGGRKAKLTR